MLNSTIIWKLRQLLSYRFRSYQLKLKFFVCYWKSIVLRWTCFSTVSSKRSILPKQNNVVFDEELSRRRKRLQPLESFEFSYVLNWNDVGDKKMFPKINRENSVTDSPWKCIYYIYLVFYFAVSMKIPIIMHLLHTKFEM